MSTHLLSYSYGATSAVFFMFSGASVAGLAKDMPEFGVPLAFITGIVGLAMGYSALKKRGAESLNHVGIFREGPNDQSAPINGTNIDKEAVEQEFKWAACTL